MIPALTSCENDETYEVIVPSLPGYGFSDAPTRAGFDPLAAAEIFLQLMSELSFDKFFVHGGDWGSVIATCMAEIDGGRHVSGLHLNMVWHPYPFTPLYLVAAALLPPSWIFGSVIEAERAFAISSWARSPSSALGRASHPSIADQLAGLWEVSGYLHQQATRPDTLAAALHDSPTALAAWIADKFWHWSDPRGGARLLQRFSADWLVANVATYWATGNAGPALRLYYEAARSRRFAAAAAARVAVPTAVADFPWELGRMPGAFVRYKYPRLVAHTAMPRGGHFAALEEPALLAADVRSAVGAMRAAR